MMKIKNLCFCIFAIFSLLPGFISATAFLKPKFSKTIDVQYLYYGTEHFWNKNGRQRQSFNEFKRSAILARAEFGLTSHCTIAAATSFNEIHESLNGKTQGFDDIDVSLKHYLGCKWGHIFATEAKAIVPVGGKKTELRYGRWGGQASLLCSNLFQFCNRSGWYDGKLGYRFYQGYPSDQIRAKATVGLCLTSRITVLGRGKLEYGLWNGSRSPQNTIRYNSNYRLLKVEGEVFFRVWRQAYLTVGGFRHVWGRNVGTGGGVFGGTRITF